MQASPTTSAIACCSSGGLWADCDVVCLCKLHLPPFAVPQEEHNGGVQCASCLMAAPKGDELVRRAEAICDAVDTRTLQWGQTGPALLTQLVRELGRESALLPVDAVCPVAYANWEDLVSGDPAVQARVREKVRGSQAVHLWHELFRRAGINGRADHPRGSLLAELQAKYLS